MSTLIAIEGIDGSGKATQARLLCEWLREKCIDVSILSFPRYDDTFFGREVRNYLRGNYGSLTQVDPRMSAILYAGDRFESLGMILRALAQEGVLVCDRYTPSNIAHQSAKLRGDKRKEFEIWVEKLEYRVFGLPRPDVVIWLDMEPNIAQKLSLQKRGAEADIHEENIEYLRSVRQVYAEMALSNGWSKIESSQRGLPKDRAMIHAEIASIVGQLPMKNA